MPTKHQVLEQLKRDELIAAVERFELPVADRRVKALLIEALASARQASLAEILGGLNRDRLKEICRALGVDDGGREKALISERLGPQRSERAPAPADHPPDSDPSRVPSHVPSRDPGPAAPPRGWTRPREGPSRPATGKAPAWQSPRAAGPRRPRAGQKRPQINIQDSFLFESLKESRVLIFALVTGIQIKGRIKRFDQFTVLVESGGRDILIYKSVISGIGVAGGGSTSRPSRY